MNKICPLLAQAFLEKTFESVLLDKTAKWKEALGFNTSVANSLLYCNKEECGWWCEKAQRCGIAAIQCNTFLMKISDNNDGI